MNFFSRIFTKIESPEPTHIVFGRFSDAFKEESRYDSWDQAMDLFEKEMYIQSYQRFLDYLKNINSNNLTYENKDKKIQFELFQGSKKIMGYCDGKVLKAYANIAQANKLNIAFLRRLLEHNFTLQYTRYALRGKNIITMVFHTSVIDASPYKLYYGLKELALHVDKQDDLLVSEFDELENLETGHIQYISEEEATSKYKFYISCIEETLEMVKTSSLDLKKYPGAESYLYLDLIYKLDYLIKPEGKVMQWIETAHKTYFSKKATQVEERNREINTLLKKMLDIDFESFKKELYTVISTFGVTTPSNHTKLANSIQNELSNMDWYYENDYPDVALAIPSYIGGYNLFSNAMPSPCRDLIHFMYMVLNPKYFEELGFHVKYERKGKLLEGAIKKRIKTLIEDNIEEYPRLKFDPADLDCNDRPVFAKSILQIISKLDCSPNTRKT